MKSISLLAIAGALCFAILSCNSYPQGQQLYEIYCSNCHQPDGSGLGAMIPDLRSSSTLRDNREYVACIIKYGSDDESAVAQYAVGMPSFKNLTSAEISNIMNFMNHNWDNNLPMVSPTEVEQALNTCQPLR